jgi:hypothetical protein
MFVDKHFFFERNLLALSAGHERLCSRLSLAETTLNRYKFLESRGGDMVPAIVNPGGGAHPLHSMVDPRREAQRLLSSTMNGAGFLVFLGFGGGYYVEAALAIPGVRGVMVIDYDINGFAELLCSADHARILEDRRLRILIDPSPGEIEECILERYQPSLDGAIRSLPLRIRTDMESGRFEEAGAAIQNAAAGLSADYSVQAWFGTRWFSNIIRNLKAAEEIRRPFPPIREAAVCAAGPSLDMQLEGLRKKHGGLFLLASDTSLPALLAAGIEPDAVISIDCQHISYKHFLGGIPQHIPLFLDLASPPLLAGMVSRPIFFSGGHPLANYVSRYWRAIPVVDSSGGNVTYAAVSLAEALGASRIEIYGADYSYPLGKSYAKGAWLFPYFENLQNRFFSIETQFSSLLYRSPDLRKKTREDGIWYYETRTLNRYREGLELKAIKTEARYSTAEGLGAPIRLPQREKTRRGNPAIFSAGPAAVKARDFLASYREKIARLPGLAREMTAEEELILKTLLPQAAALKRREALNSGEEVLEAVKGYCMGEIEKVLEAVYKE